MVGYSQRRYNHVDCVDDLMSQALCVGVEDASSFCVLSLVELNTSDQRNRRVRGGTPIPYALFVKEAYAKKG